MNAVCIIASRKHGTLYIGVTSELLRRVGQHREGEIEGFTKRHGVKRLAWFELHDSVVAAIQREKSLKKYRRDGKINLIERDNPGWDDLFPQFFVEDGPFPHRQTREPSM
ncbi:GIY-YIG nuclease family protein [Phenylobacterium sp.]|uniref:GIY-YIG nuclease family protein n=1 Tax=Phenylobacterium sp. TaxID=1871053 RepID=UPI0025D862CE|nr:GIY-YIG nuclease family protein [Phenylobacterium sp.]